MPTDRRQTAVGPSGQQRGAPARKADQPGAPTLVPRGKTAQVTLRLPGAVLARIKGVAGARSVPFTTLTRSWLIAGVRDPEVPEIAAQNTPQDEQLNIKLERDVLDELKVRAHELGRPYHRLARELIEDRLKREEERLVRGEREVKAGLGRKGVSPYSTGGGGVTLEHRVTVRYLALLLTGDGQPELGKDRSVSSVAFQQSPTSAVDDLVIEAKRASESSPSLRLAIAVRRNPSFVRSHAPTQKLVDDFVSAFWQQPLDNPERRFALAVAGPREHAEQLAELASYASKQMDADGFYRLVLGQGEDDGLRRELRERLKHLTEMVGSSLTSLGIEGADETATHQQVWQLVSRLSILMPRVEDPEIADWFDVQNRLRGVSHGRDLTSAGILLDRLEVLAGQFGPAGARIDRTMLRREVHGLIDEAATRNKEGWRELGDLHKQAMRVRVHLGDGDRQLQINRADQADALLAQAKGAPAVLVHGGSGVGKSALVVHRLCQAAKESEDIDVLCLDLRLLPVTTLDLSRALGAPLATLLAEMSAPHRFVVLDGADAATETRAEMFAYVISAAREASVTPVVIVSNESRRVALDVLKDHIGTEIPEFAVTPLSDEELARVSTTFPELELLTKNPRSRELLRRPVIVDLLVRSETSSPLLSDAEAMDQIWAGLVRNHERKDKGSPEARERALLALAQHELSGAGATKLTGNVDSQAIVALRRDGVLKPSSGRAWEITPEFSHDELRRYAVARALLIEGDPVAVLQSANAPRWALSGAVLATQSLLAAFDGSAGSAHSLETLQSAFDLLAEAGHGARWADVPIEALLGLGDPLPMLKSAWPELRDDGGLSRILRLLRQRHTRNGIPEPLVAEPVVKLLLDEETPWRLSEEVATCLREWLVALTIADRPAGDPVRQRLHDRLMSACAAAEARAARAAEEAERKRANRSAEEVRRDEQDAKKNAFWFSELGVGPRTRRRRRVLPRELLDETVVELVALLARDLGEDGEELLRRVAKDAPDALAPALEELLADRALASYGRGLLADLAEAYYIDDEPHGGIHEDGIRDHHWRGPITPMAAYYRGPFLVLLQSDPRRGVAVVNRILNHAALARTRTLASLNGPWGRRPPDNDFVPQGAELGIAGSPRRYIGDEHVWLWYRGSGVGPCPCMSALQACELFCEQLLEAGIPITRLVDLLLEGCENLAMLGMVVGLLVRHLEEAGPAIDPFLAEPYIWGYEIRRIVSENGGVAIRQHGVLESERRRWSFKEVAGWLVLNADDARADRLREVAAQMIAKSEALETAFKEHLAASGEDIQPNADRGIPYVMTVRNWASWLERDRYRIYEENDQTYVASTPPEEVQEALRQSNAELARGQEGIRIVNRYFIEPRKADPSRESPNTEELEADLRSVMELLENPPPFSAVDVPDAAALVAAAALEAHLVRQQELPRDLLVFAGEVLLEVAEQSAPGNSPEYEGSLFEQGSDRTAARGLPLLLLPQAHALRDALGGPARVAGASARLARAGPSETRLALARGLDPLWGAPCNGTPCHHEQALRLLLDSMRDCVLGDFDVQQQQQTVELLEGELPEALQAVEAKRLLPEKLDPAIRGLGTASVRDCCVQARARELLVALTEAQRSSLVAHGENLDHRGSHAMVAARSLLALAAFGDDEPLLAYVRLHTGRRLATLLRAITAAAEETTQRAAAAARLWPVIIDSVLEIAARDPAALGDRDGGDGVLAALAPMRVQDVQFLYREMEDFRVEWRDPLAWREAIERWIPLAAGRSNCVDATIGMIDALAPAQQATIGLDWVRTLALADPQNVAKGSFMVTRWLVEIRPAADAAKQLGPWQQLVDALVVGGATSLASYSE